MTNFNQMNEQELSAYHLGLQAREIAEMTAQKEPFEKTIAGINLTILPNVYPGGLDSELMCEIIEISKGDEVLDLCTGTGIIALKAAQLGAAKVVGVDLNPYAVKNASTNKGKFGLRNIEIREGSLFEPVKGEKFDVITVNPPYTNKKSANKTEICFWDENNQTTRQFFQEFKDHLEPHGRVYFAWADFGNMDLLDNLARENGVSLKLLGSKKTPSGLATFLVYKIEEHWKVIAFS